MTSLLAATPGPSGGVAAGRMDSGGLGVALPSASAGRSRLLPEVFHDCSYVGRRLSLLVVGPPSGAVSVLETGGIGCSESCEKKEVLQFVRRPSSSPLSDS